MPPPTGLLRRRGLSLRIVGEPADPSTSARIPVNHLTPRETIVVRINEHYLTLKPTYLFPEIARRVKAFAAAHPGRPAHPAGHRRRHPAAGADGRARHARGRRRDGAGRDVPRLRAGDGLRVPDRAHRGPRLRGARRPRRDRRDLRERRRQERHRQHPGDLRRRRAGRARRPGLSRLRGHQRHGGPGRHGRARTGATRASSTCPPPPRTASGPRSPIARSISSTSATRTTRPAR